jgi:hypothetical protein
MERLEGNWKNGRQIYCQTVVIGVKISLSPLNAMLLISICFFEG